MEYKNLGPIVMMLVIASLLIGTGLVVFDKFKVAGSDLVYYNDTITLVASTNTAFTKTWVHEIVFLGNASDTCTDYTSYLDRETSSITYGTPSGSCAGSVGAYYSYRDVSRTFGTTMGYASTALGSISQNWMSLLIIIVIMSIILYMVLQSFTGRK